MQTKKVINFLLILGLGFALGWLLKPQTLQISENMAAVGPPMAPLKSNRDTAKIAVAEKSQVDKAIQNQYDTASASSANQLAQAKIAKAKEWTLEEILEAIHQEDNYELYNGDLFDYFRSKPELAKQLLDQFLGLESPFAKQIAVELLRVANSNNDFAVEKQIIEKIQLGQNQGEWLSMLADFGISTPESMDFLSQKLDYSLQGQEITDALNAINTGANRLFNKIPRQTRELLTKQLAKQVNSPNPETRAAAIYSLAAYPVPDSETVIISALSDPNRIVQYSALQTLMRGEFQSSEIRDALMTVVRDNSIDLNLRAATAQTLRRYNLEGQDYDDLYNFNQELAQRRQRRRPNQ